MTDEVLFEADQRFHEMQLQNRIKAARNEALKPQMPALGHCYDCLENFPDNDPHKHERKFCDQLCAQSWQEWFDSMKRNHGSGFRPVPAY